MSHWANIALAARLTSGDRQRALKDLLALRDPTPRAQVVVATPRRFVSIRKLIKPNAAVTAMLDVMSATHRVAAQKGLSCQLALSDRPDTAHSPLIYLSHHTINTPAFDTLRAAGTDVWHFKAADLPGRECFDPQGFAGWASLARKAPADLDIPGVSTSEIDTHFQTAKAQALSQNQSKYAQSTALTELPETYVFVALQTIGDMVQRNAFVPMLDMLAMVVDRFAGTDHSVVIKRHPKCKSRKVAAALAALSGREGVIVTDGSIHQIMAKASAVFTVNSGVGAESIIHEVPLYCFGAADYAPVAHQIKSRADLDAATAPIRFARSPDDIRKFLYYYRNIYQVALGADLETRLQSLITAAQDR